MYFLSQEKMMVTHPRRTYSCFRILSTLVLSLNMKACHTFYDSTLICCRQLVYHYICQLIRWVKYFFCFESTQSIILYSKLKTFVLSQNVTPLCDIKCWDEGPTDKSNSVNLPIPFILHEKVFDYSKVRFIQVQSKWCNKNAL